MLFQKGFIFLILFLQNISGEENAFFNFKLNDVDKHSVSFSDFKSNKASVIVFLLSDCPASQSYTTTLNKLSKKYLPEKIKFYGVFPGKFSTTEELKSFQKIYMISFPLLMDPEMSFSKYMKASIAPSCFVVDSTGKIIYKGRIDDWLYALGKKRQVITENNLDDALKSVSKNLPVKKSETTPIGCILEYDN
jgi:peroxiredoxin